MLSDFQVSAVTLLSSTSLKIDAADVLREMREDRALSMLEGMMRGGSPQDENALRPGVPAWARVKAYREKLTFPAMQEEAREFVDLIGGIEGFSQWHALSRLKKRRDEEFVRHAERLAEVAKATFSPLEESGTDIVCDLIGESFGDAEAILRAQSYRSDSGEGTEAPPFAWATTALVWEGVTPAMVEEVIDDIEADDEAASAEEVASRLLAKAEAHLDDEHHEDARDLVVAPDDLKAIVREWFPYRSTEDGDALLGKLFLEWNRKQTIVSYYMDRNRIVGLRPDVSKDDCVDYARRRASAAAVRAEAVSGLWREPYRGDRGEFARNLEETGVHISKDPYRPEWIVWKDERKAVFPTFETAAEYTAAPGAKP